MADQRAKDMRNRILEELCEHPEILDEDQVGHLTDGQLERLLAMVRNGEELTDVLDELGASAEPEP
jgi:hypothetical protein